MSSVSLVEGRASFSHTGCRALQNRRFELFYITVHCYFSLIRRFMYLDGTLQLLSSVATSGNGKTWWVDGYDRLEREVEDKSCGLVHSGLVECRSS